MTLVSEAEQNLKIAKIKEIFSNSACNVPKSSNEELVAFFGPTKAGKSTLINCLMKNPMKCKINPKTEATTTVSVNPKRGPIIGEGGESSTSVPQCYSTIPDTNLSMWDFPGLFDNKGTEQEIANAAAYNEILGNRNSVRFILVVTVDMIKSADPMPFFKLINTMVTICPNINESICIIGTKSEKGSVKAWLENAEMSSFDSANKENLEIIRTAKNVIKNVLINEHCVDFKAPVMKGDLLEDIFLLPNLIEIIEVIKSIRATNVDEFPIVLSDQAKNEIGTLYTELYHKVGNDIREFSTLFDTTEQNKIEGIMNNPHSIGSSGRLGLFKQGKQNIEDKCQNSTDFNSFFIEMEKTGMHIKTLRDSVETFKFIENIQNLYKPKDIRKAQGENEFFTRILLHVDSSAQKYSDLIKNSEAASEEEKRMEQLWKEVKEREQELLKKQLKDYEKENNTFLVSIARNISKFFGIISDQNNEIKPESETDC